MAQPKFYLTEPDERFMTDPVPVAQINVGILQIAKQHNFMIEDWGADGLGQELGQRLALPDGRHFFLHFLVHAQEQDGNQTYIMLPISTKPTRKDLLDVLAALDIPESAITWESELLTQQPPHPAPKP